MKKNSAVLAFPLKPRAPKPPKTLGAAGRALWRSIQSEYSVVDAGGIAHLLTACRSENDISVWREAVAKDGPIVVDRFGQQKSHPLIKEIAQAEAVRRAALLALNLNIEPLQDRPGRPAGK